MLLICINEDLTFEPVPKPTDRMGMEPSLQPPGEGQGTNHRTVSPVADAPDGAQSFPFPKSKYNIHAESVLHFSGRPDAPLIAKKRRKKTSPNTGGQRKAESYARSQAAERWVVTVR